jgi:hypothetical protein
VSLGLLNFLQSTIPLNNTKMGASQLTETIIIRLKEGITLQDISSDTPATKAFKKLTESIKSQAGFTRQYWARTPLVF